MAVRDANWETRETSCGLQLQVRIQKSSFIIGEELKLELSLQNTQATPATVTFTSSQRFDFFLSDRNGRKVYSWSRDKVFLAVVVEVTQQIDR